MLMASTEMPLSDMAGLQVELREPLRSTALVTPEVELDEMGGKASADDAMLCMACCETPPKLAGTRPRLPRLIPAKSCARSDALPPIRETSLGNSPVVKSIPSAFNVTSCPFASGYKILTIT